MKHFALALVAVVSLAAAAVAQDEIVIPATSMVAVGSSPAAIDPLDTPDAQYTGIRMPAGVASSATLITAVPSVWYGSQVDVYFGVSMDYNGLPTGCEVRVRGGLHVAGYYVNPLPVTFEPAGMPAVTEQYISRNSVGDDNSGALRVFVRNDGLTGVGWCEYDVLVHYVRLVRVPPETSRFHPAAKRRKAWSQRS